MTLNPKIGVLVNFSRSQAATYVSRVNCAEITGDRPRQPAYEIKLMLSRYDAIEMALDKPLWGLLAASGATP